MAKVQQKSEKITAFGGIFFVLDKFDSILSSVIDSHHRSFDNFMVNLLGALAAYCFFPKKPCIACERAIDNQLTLF